MKGADGAMKKVISAVFVLMAMLIGNTCLAAEVDTRTGMQFNWWGSDEDDSGMQFIIPVSVASSYKDVSLELLGGYVFSQVNPDGGKRRSISQAADTKLNVSYGVYDRLPFDVLFGLGFNLPTGHTDLSRSEAVLIVPPDLFPIPTFGEGLNINPTITVAKDWGRFIAGAGIGYTWRGEYDYSSLYPDYDPGEVLTLTGEAGYDITERIFGKIYGQYISYAKDTVDGDDFYQEGDVKLIGLGLTYDRETWNVGFNLAGILRGKSKVQQGLALPTEDHNGHGNELNTGITYRYHTDPKTTVRTSLELLLIAENDYASTSPFFVGKRQKVTLGCGFDKTLAENFTGSVGIEGFIMDDEKNWYHPGEDVTYRGIGLSAQVSKRF
jgi:hypothetical protein